VVNVILRKTCIIDISSKGRGGKYDEMKENVLRYVVQSSCIGEGICDENKENLLKKCRVCGEEIYGKIYENVLSGVCGCARALHA
jgi:hypothetical protein